MNADGFTFCIAACTFVAGRHWLIFVAVNLLNLRRRERGVVKAEVVELTVEAPPERVVRASDFDLLRGVKAHVSVLLPVPDSTPSM